MIANTRWSRTSLLVVCIATSAAGCGSGTTPGADGMTGTLAPDAGACVTGPGAGAVGCTTRDGQGLADLPRNGLTRGALSASGTREVLDRIAIHPLSTATLDSGDVSEMTRHSTDVQSLLGYIVSCALDRTAEVSFRVDAEGSRKVWNGHLGLCGATSPFGNWALGAPSQDCLELVSSCVLARVNARQQKVLISMRGAPDCLFPLQPRVPVQEAYRDNNGTPPIPSFSPCASDAPHADPTRNCGWQGRWVGRCQPGTPVTLMASPETRANTMLRICKGIYGCDEDPTPPPPYYAGVIESNGSFGVTRSMTFTCPRNGVAPTAPSYFSVMVASHVAHPHLDLPESTDAVIVAGGTYPSPETEVFTYREGAFFGDLFRRIPARPDPQVPETANEILVADQYACYSDTWHSGIAHLTDRYCADPYYSCFDNKVRPCLWKSRQPGMPAPDRVCGAQSCDEQNRYADCSWDSPPWNHPITVFLNHPCDLAKDRASCGKAYPPVLDQQNW